VAYKVRGSAPASVLKQKIMDAMHRHDIRVHGKELRVVLEQSAERRRDYAQFSKPKDALMEEVCQKSLRLYSKGTWELLGKPSEQGWQWHARSFQVAGVGLPSSLGGGGGVPEGQGAKRRLGAEGADERQESVVVDVEVVVAAREGGEVMDLDAVGEEPAVQA